MKGDPIKLNEVARRAGEVGTLRDVWILSIYDPDRRYFIETDDGSTQVEVRSVGRIGRFYYYAPDERFVSFPVDEFVFPVKPKLRIQTTRDGVGRYSVSLHCGSACVANSDLQDDEQLAISQLLWILETDVEIERFGNSAVIVAALCLRRDDIKKAAKRKKANDEIERAK